MKVEIPVAKEYVQDGYRTHINESKVTFFSGFNLAERFPSTNMVIKVVAKPENYQPKEEKTLSATHFPQTRMQLQ